MYRKSLVACVTAALLLAASPALAGPPGPKKPSPPGPFSLAVNPTLSGFASDMAFWNVPVTFKNNVYDAVADYTLGLQVIRSADGKRWDKLPMPMPTDTNYNNAWGAFVYQDQLYLSLNQDRCEDPSIQTPGLIVRTKDGKTWQTVFQAGLVNGLVNQTGQFGTFKGMLYAVSLVGFGQTGATQIWRSKSGDPGTWELATPVFGNNTDFTSPLTTFKGNAYLASHDATGMHLWRSADGATWQTVGETTFNVNNGAVTNWVGSPLVVFKDMLYLGTNPWFYFLGMVYPGGSYDPANYLGGNLYRSKDGVKWEQVVTNGFGGATYKAGIDSLVVVNGQLLAFSNDLAPDWSTGVTNVWRSRTGNSGDWALVSPAGMGSGTLVTKADQAIFKDDLYIGSQLGYGSGTFVVKMNKP